MDICGCSCFTWLITACRSGTEVAVRLFLTHHSPLPAVHKTVLSRPLSPQGLESRLALLAQRRPLLVFHILVSNALPSWGPNCVRDRLAPAAFHRWLVAEQSSTSIRDCVLCL